MNTLAWVCVFVTMSAASVVMWTRAWRQRRVERQAILTVIHGHGITVTFPTEPDRRRPGKPPPINDRKKLERWLEE